MKHIPRPVLTGAKVLTAAELNKIHFSDKHTRLTPAQLNKLARS